ncbi:MAG TPA: hypothetical protein VFC96_02745 [Anaerovoracaceae bacterium]|nr:hypothetical protein [Anaerovoracaceae bacterium]
MYRIVCESYENYKNDFQPNHEDDYRYVITKPLELIVDLDLYEKEKRRNTVKYQKLQHLIYLLKKNIEEYPNFKSFLWSLESRNILGKDYDVLSEEEFRELARIVNMFLRLAYWDDEKRK